MFHTSSAQALLGHSPPVSPTPDQYPVLLRTAADLVRRGWNQHRSAIDADGTSCGYYSRKAVSFCMIGSVYRVILDAMGGDREVAHTPEFRLVVNRLTRYLALTMPHIIPMEIALSHDADDPHYGIEARLAAWNDSIATQRSAVRALEAAADLADYDIRANPGCRLADCAGEIHPDRQDAGQSIFGLAAFESGIRSAMNPLRAIEDILYMSPPLGMKNVRPRSGAALEASETAVRQREQVDA